MKSSPLILTLFFLSVLAAALMSAPSACVAQYSEEETAPLPLEREPWVASGHPVGDTIGRGIDFLLRPVYGGAGGLYFFLLEPPEPKYITELQMLGCPAQPAPAPMPAQQAQPRPPAPPSPEPALQP